MGVLHPKKALYNKVYKKTIYIKTDKLPEDFVLPTSVEAKKEKLAEEKAEKKAAKEAKHDNYSANSSQSIKTEHHHNSGAPAGNHGDMNTANSGKLVGNRNSKIYHVPGQAGYRMNSANAVYFDSEAEAKAAGYRKALR